MLEGTDFKDHTVFRLYPKNLYDKFLTFTMCLKREVTFFTEFYTASAA